MPLNLAAGGGYQSEILTLRTVSSSIIGEGRGGLEGSWEFAQHSERKCDNREDNGYNDFGEMIKETVMISNDSVEF